MTHVELHRAIARATGESLSVIAGRGFQLLDVEPTAADQETCADAEDQYIDWEELELKRNVALIEQPSRRVPARA